MDEETANEVLRSFGNPPMRGKSWMRWQPIENAPKDGTDIIGYVKKRGKVWPVYYDEESGVWWRFDRVKIDTPTHWMPLPPHPSEQ